MNKDINWNIARTKKIHNTWRERENEKNSNHDMDNRHVYPSSLWL